MSALPLTTHQRRRLEKQLHTTSDAGVFRRTLAILEVARGVSVTEVARLLRTSRVSVHHWLATYAQNHDAAVLADHRGGNRPTVWTDHLLATLRDCLGQSPEQFGYQAVSWTVGLLQQQLAPHGADGLSTRTIRRQLDAWGYVWKRPRYVLDPDPERDKKTTHSGTPAATAAALCQAV